MKRITYDKLIEKLNRHKLWLDSEGKKGDRLDLSYSDLSYSDLRGSNLSGSNLSGSNLRGSNLSDSDLRDSDLRGSNLSGSNLSGSNLSGSNLRHSDLRGSNLSGSNLRHSDLRHSDLSYSDLRHSDLRHSDLSYSSWPLWCGSLTAHVDDRIAVQLLYHTLSVVQNSPYVSDELKKRLLIANIVEAANQFHRVDECCVIETYRKDEQDALDADKCQAAVQQQGCEKNSDKEAENKGGCTVESRAKSEVQNMVTD